VLLGALRRFTAVVLVAVAGACLLGLLIAAVAHDDLRRGLAIGLYASGAALTGLALLLGTRPPVRSKGDGGFVGLGRWVGTGVRWAARDEQDEAINLPALLLTVGVVLVVIGIGVDDRH
jgi:hypothetical protein